MNHDKKLGPTFFVLLVFFSIGIFAQEQEYIVGKLFDSKSGEPVVFANIRIKDRAVGIITNVDGSFRIPLRYQEYGDIIEISSMGYRTKEIPISEFTQGELNRILIDPGAIDLQEAIVKGKDKSKRNLNAKQIVQRAIDAIPRNYPSTSFSTIGYYRDYQFNKGKYINLSEVILEVFDQGFDQLDDGTSEVRLFSMNLNKDFEEDSMARQAYDYESMQKIINKAHLDAYGGNEFRILRIHDAIRNYNVGSYDFVGTLKSDLIKNHFFLRSRDVSIEGDQLYVIKFWVFHPNYRANGTIYISKSDFAIYKLEYTMYDEKKWTKDRKKNKHGHKKKPIFDITTEYRKIDNKMYLNYISFHNSFEVRKPPKFVLDSTLVNAPEGYCTLYFNKQTDSISAMKSKNYDVIFKRKKFRVERIKVFQDSVRIHLEPDFKQAMINSRGEINTSIRKRKDADDLFDIQVKKIRDVDGNLVNEPEILDYYQYREFFVQRVKLESRAPLDNLFMDKRKPIFKNQPAIKPKDYDDYWMNTPLLEGIN